MQEPGIKISAVVICRNEEKNILRCIRSLRPLCDDIIIVDSGSTDQTVQIAESEGAKVYHRNWTGYSDQKNYGNALARHDFIISIDADEELSEELRNNIRKEFSNPLHSAYEFDFLTSWNDKFIRHGGWIPDAHIRLFDKTKIQWGSKGVHEELLLNGLPSKKIKGYVLHYTASNRSYYRSKMDRYAQEFASNKLKLGKRSPAWKKYISSGFRFFRDYILKRGFLEGQAGWEIAAEEARYTYLKYKWSE